MEWRIIAYCPQGHPGQVLLTPGGGDYLLTAPASCKTCDDETAQELDRLMRKIARRIRRERRSGRSSS